MTSTESSPARDWRVPALILVPTALIFLGYEVLERTWLRGADMDVLHLLHRLRGLGTTVAVSTAVALYLTRRSRRILAEPLPPAEPPGTTEHHVDWFINLRWLAVLGVATAVVLSQHVLHLLSPALTPALWAGVAALAAANLAFRALRRRLRRQTQLALQTGADLGVLTYLLHFSGGLENPFVIVYVFHVILASILFPPRRAYGVTAAVSLLVVGLAGAEGSGLLPHYTLQVFPHEEAAHGEVLHAAHRLSFVLTVTGALVALFFGAAYFTTTVVSRLRASQEHLLRAERLKALGQLVGYVVHEVNNPIGIISTRVKLLRAKGGANADPRLVGETLAVVDRQSDRVARVVRSLLNFARPARESRGPVDVNACVEEAITYLQRRFADRGVVLTWKLEPGLPPVTGSHTDLVHVFVNLLTNSLDAMPRGGRLRIRTALRDGAVEVEVEDTGVGIPAAALPRVFEPFYTTKEDTEGTGLGLSFVRSVVRGMGGEVGVTSRPGAGTSFRLRFPVLGVRREG